jgi:hypothetical protein
VRVSVDALKVRFAFIETSPPFAKENQREREKRNKTLRTQKKRTFSGTGAEAPSSSASAFSRSSVGSSTIFSLIQMCFDLIDDFTCRKESKKKE